MNFIGASSMEIITDQAFKDGVIGTLKQLGTLNIPGLNIFETAACSRKDGESQAQQSGRNRNMAIHRQRKNV